MPAARAVSESERASIGAADIALCTVADSLTAHGLDVWSPAFDESRFLKLINVDRAISEVTISTNGSVAWEYRPCHGNLPDPAQSTGTVLTLLGASPPVSHGERTMHCLDATLKARVGRALAECGMQVSLVVMDEGSYDIYAEIEVTNPAQRARGKVRLADDGMIWWKCRLKHSADDTGGIEAGAIAVTVARILTSTT